MTILSKLQPLGRRATSTLGAVTITELIVLKTFLLSVNSLVPFRAWW